MNSSIKILSMLLALTGIQTAQVALAAEIAAEAPITAVTVYGGRAEVTRTARFQVSPGDHILVISGLTSDLDPDTAQVTTSGADTLIGAVEMDEIIEGALSNQRERALTAELLALQDRRNALEDDMATAQLQLKFLEAMAEGYPVEGRKDAAEGQADTETWVRALAVLGTGASKARKRIRESKVAHRNLGLEINALRRRIKQIRTGDREYFQARIALGAAAAGSVQVTLTYQVYDATWAPRYEARLNSENGSLRLVQMANVSQVTGEDWTDITLTLATGRPAEGVEMPELDPWFIDFMRPQPVIGRRLKRAAEAPAEMDGFADTAPELEEMIVSGSRTSSSVATTEFSARYRIPGRVSIESIDEDGSFFIGEKTLETALAVRAIPAEESVGYLYGTVKYTDDDPLPAGQLAVYRDGTFTGTGYLDILRPGEEAEISFGVDEGVNIERRFDGEERSVGGIISKRTAIERRYTIEVQNLHRRAFDIEILDQLPVSQHEDIEVRLLDSATPPDERDVGDEPGILAWRGKYEPGEKRIIKLHYAVSYPKDQQLEDF
jgi:uncharacterized protein (TIGR02231 family)